MRILVLIFLGVVACTQKPATLVVPGVESAPGSGAALAEHGKKVYNQNCTSCHNPNPKLDGSVGPAIAGSSLELVSMRVMSAQYPAGYKPKRATGFMAPLPGLKSEIPALHAFLNQ